MPFRFPGSALERFFSIRVRPLVLVCALFVVIALGVMAISAQSDSTEALRERLTDLRIERDQRYKEYKQLEYELSNIKTEDYIKSKAREEYNYQMPDEIRFVITNLDPETGENLVMTITEGNE